MNFSETLRLALAAIWAHKLRSFLTLLGMIIGVTAFMVVLSILQGFNAYVDDKIAGIGSNSFTVMRFSFEDFRDSDRLAEAQRRNKDLTLEELEFIREKADLIKQIGAKARGTGSQVKRGTEILEEVDVSGAEPIIAEIDKIEIQDGRYFVESEDSGSARVAFIGADIATKLFPRTGAVGEEISIAGLPYRIVGVAVAKGTVFGQPLDNYIQVPLKTYQTNFGNSIGRRGLYFQATAFSDDLFEDAVEQARTLLRIKRRLAFGEKDNFGIRTPDAIAGLRDSLFGTLGIVIIAVPTIALVVGAIVIMNIMLVAVTERTKEIGIRKSLGARQSDILKQFLYEAATLSTIGGLVGLILAQIIGYIISVKIIETRIPWWAIVLAIGVSAGVGILAGLFPAWKAARLDPIEALRAE